jgi:hypothetical protein
MKKPIATKKTMSFIQKRYKEVVIKEKTTLEKVFLTKKGAVNGVTVSGATLRKMFNGQYVHFNTIAKVLEEFNKEWDLDKNGKIDIDND